MTQTAGCLSLDESCRQGVACPEFPCLWAQCFQHPPGLPCPSPTRGIPRIPLLSSGRTPQPRAHSSPLLCSLRILIRWISSCWSPNVLMGVGTQEVPRETGALSHPPLHLTVVLCACTRETVLPFPSSSSFPAQGLAAWEVELASSAPSSRA